MRVQVHRHLSPDEGADDVYDQQSEEDHRVPVGTRRHVLRPLAGTGHDQIQDVPRRRRRRVLYLQAASRSVPHLLHARPAVILRGAVGADVSAVRANRTGSGHQLQTRNGDDEGLAEGGQRNGGVRLFRRADGSQQQHQLPHSGSLIRQYTELTYLLACLLTYLPTVASRGCSGSNW